MYTNSALIVRSRVLNAFHDDAFSINETKVAPPICV